MGDKECWMNKTLDELKEKKKEWNDTLNGWKQKVLKWRQNFPLLDTKYSKISV